MRCVLVGLISLLAICVAAAQTIDVKTLDGDKIAVNVKDAPVADVIAVLFSLRPGRNYIMRHGVTGGVTLNLPSVEWETALKYVAEQVHARWHKDENGVYLIERDPAVPWVSLLSPVAAPLKQGDIQRYLIDAHSFHEARYLIFTLHTFKGDADLFVGFDGDVAPDKCALKSVNGPLQVDQIIYHDSPKKRPIYIAVYGVTDSEYVLSVNAVRREVQTTPAQPRVFKVTAQTITGSDDLLVTGLTVENLTSAWYEVTVTQEGKALEKCSIPQRWILGPKLRRYYGYVALDDKSKLTFYLNRNTLKARAYLVADLVVRLVNNGRPMSPDMGDAVEDLMPRLLALAPAAVKFQRGDWRGGGEELLRVIQRRPDVLYALHQVVQRSGINISRVLLASKIGAGFGALSASLQALAASKAPAEERVEVRLRKWGD
ncbi:MAG: hypothetical protein NZT92_01220 [Abditibacteriales bacterium]|nr:hypothetical protein [Abditibacteriales bacterium]MDW8364536.1 hypothetical protein [Abditibacteriales bacterium]